MILTTDYGVDVMVKYIVLVLIGCLLIAQSVEAETKNTRQVGIGLGLFLMRSKDNLASPFTYSGDGRGWLIKYRAQNAKRRHQISFMWDTGLLTSSLTRGRNHRVELTRIQVRYAYHRSFRSESPGRIRLLWGVVQQAFIHARRQFYSQSRREYFGELVGSVQPSIALHFAWTDRSSLSYDLSVSALAFLWRHAYGMGGGGNFDITSLHQFLSVEHNLIWTHNLSNRWSIQIQYWGQLYRYTEPRRVQIGIDHLSALINWRF